MTFVLKSIKFKQTSSPTEDTMPHASMHRQPTGDVLLVQSPDQVAAIITGTSNGTGNILLLRNQHNKLCLPGGDRERHECENGAIHRLVKIQTQTTSHGVSPVGIFHGRGRIFVFQIISDKNLFHERNEGGPTFFSISDIKTFKKEIDPVAFQIIGYYVSYWNPGSFLFEQLTPWFEVKKKAWKPKGRRLTTN